MMKTIQNLVPFILAILVTACSKDLVDDTIVEQNPPTAFEINVTPKDSISDTVRIGWSESIDPEGTGISYSLSVNGVITAENLDGLSYTLDSLEANTEYSIEVIALDRNEQSTSAQFTFTTLEEEQEEEEEVEVEVEPVNLLFVEADVDNITFDSALVIWAVATAPTDPTIRYDIHLDEIEIISGSKVSSYQFANLEPLTEYSVMVTAKAEDGKISSEIMVFTTLATPPNPSQFGIEVTDRTTFSVSVQWSESLDPDEGAIVYDIFIDDEKVLSNGNDTFYTFEDLRIDRSYTVKVVAKTDKGGTTTATQVVMTDPPGEPLPDFEVMISEIDTQSALVQWDQVISPSGEAVVYDLYVDGELRAGDRTDTQFDLSGLDQNTAYTVLVVAKAMGHPTSESRITFRTL